MGTCVSRGDLCIEQQSSNVEYDNCDESDVNINNFKIGSYLGIGGSGVVRSVVKLGGKNSGQAFALKSLSKSALLRKQSGPNSALNELKILITIAEHSSSNNFIANISYAFQDYSHVYIILDHCSNGDLRFNLSRFGNFKENIVQFFAAQICLALNTIWSLNILHRDIKPENLLICSNGYLKLTDFGVSKMLINVDRCYSTSGTHGYMAPEVYLAGYGVFHGRTADLFSLGVMLYELLLGKRPFAIDHFKGIKSLGAAPCFDLTPLWRLKNVSIHCKQFINQLLMIHPTHRPFNFSREIQSHSWFLSENFDWSAISCGTLVSPIATTTSNNASKLDVGSRNVQMALMKHKKQSEQIFNDEEQLKFENFKYPVVPSSLTLDCTTWGKDTNTNASILSPLPISPHSHSRIIANTNVNMDSVARTRIKMLYNGARHNNTKHSNGNGNSNSHSHSNNSSISSSNSKIR